MRAATMRMSAAWLIAMALGPVHLFPLESEIEQTWNTVKGPGGAGFMAWAHELRGRLVGLVARRGPLHCRRDSESRSPRRQLPLAGPDSRERLLTAIIFSSTFEEAKI